jgi:hypothetical protein
LTDLNANSDPVDYVSEERWLVRAGEQTDAGIGVVVSEVRGCTERDAGQLGRNRVIQIEWRSTVIDTRLGHGVSVASSGTTNCYTLTYVAISEGKTSSLVAVEHTLIAKFRAFVSIVSWRANHNALVCCIVREVSPIAPINAPIGEIISISANWTAGDA